MHESTRSGAAARGRVAAMLAMSFLTTMLLVGSSPMIDAAMAAPASAPAAKAQGSATAARSRAVHLPRGPHITPFGPARHVKPASPPHLDYYGGQVASDIRVYEILYGTGTYMSQVTGPQTGQFFAGVTNSPYMDWLSQYDTVGVPPVGGGQGTSQRIGRGTFAGMLQINPSAGNNGSTIFDSQVQTEIANQILGGAIPFPDANTLYSVFFPNGKSICLAGGQCSMRAGGFCAYHSTSTVNSSEFYYAVMPDFSAAGPGQGCGGSSPFNNMTSTASHEMVETMTDAGVGLAQYAWVDAANNAEIGDLCNQVQGSVVGGDGNPYTVQAEWSNADNACIVQHFYNHGTYNATNTFLGQTHDFYYDTTSGPGSLRHAVSSGGRWFYETLDGSLAGSTANGRTTDNVGSHVSTTVYAGQLHVFYYDAQVGSLRHAWYDGAWHFETLDGPGTVYPGSPGVTPSDNVGQFTSVTLYAGQPHVWYYDATAHSLRHGWWDGHRWDFETLDGPGTFYGRSPGVTSDPVGQFTSVMLYAGQPHVWYYDEAAQSLRHGWWGGSTWYFETLDGAGTFYPRSPGVITNQNVGGYTSVTLYQGQPQVWYYDFTVGSLRHAWWSVSAWYFETLDGTGSTYPGATNLNVGRYAAVTLYFGQPHVWYYQQSTKGSLRHGWWTGTRWAFDTIDGTGTTYPGAPDVNTTDSLGTFNSVLLVNGRPEDWYFDTTAKLPRHAFFDGAQWNFEMLDT